MADLQPGAEFAGYRVEGLAGYGGMGVVYRATDPGLERQVALKLISTDLSRNAAFQRRFEAESKIAASLDHPNVIPIFHAGEHDGVLYLVMRYVEGNDLSEEITENGRLTPERTVRIVAQVSSALDAAHSRGLVHRDVKPANILLASGDHAYLTDFGLTKRLLTDADETITGNLLGTLDYVAPEQIKGTELGPHTDVYALGCVLFHAVTGKAPFAALEREAKLWAHVSEPPPSLGPDGPPALDRVIVRAMAKEPAERYRSAGELAEAATEALTEAAAAPSPAGANPAGGGSPAPGTAGVGPIVPAGLPPADDAPLLANSPLYTRQASDKPPGYRRALIIHALFTPFSFALLLVTLTAGLLFATPAVAIAVALFVYGAAVLVVCLDGDVQQRILASKLPVDREIS